MPEELDLPFGAELPRQMFPVDPRQVRNAAGGWVFPVSKWDRLLRFLIIGTEGGTFYATEERIQAENIVNVANCLAQDGPRVVEMAAEVSQSGRAYRRSPSLYVLALAFRSQDEKTRRAAADHFTRIVQTGSDLLMFASFMKQTETGWGRMKRAAVRQWFATRKPEDLAFQFLKYRQREGKTQRDLILLAHPRPSDFRDEVQQEIIRWVVKGGWKKIPENPPDHPALRLIWAFERANRARDEQEIINLINDHRLTWELVPTHFLKSANVWKALLPHLPANALIRHLGHITSLGVLADQEARQKLLGRLEGIANAKIHPVRLLIAAVVYARGQGMRRTWTPDPEVSKALEKAFLQKVRTEAPISKPFLVGLDISGSMWHTTRADYAAPIIAAAAYGFYIMHAEPKATVVVFDEGIHRLVKEAAPNLPQLLKLLKDLGQGGTDLSLPFEYAHEHYADMEGLAAVVVVTDNETWAGWGHPFEELRKLRELNPYVRAINVACTATGYGLTEPDDPLAFQIVGFDPIVPEIIREIVEAEPPTG